MAFKFSKADIKERDEMVEAAKAKLTILNGAIDKFNESLNEAWGEVEEALNDYNGALSDARDFVERVKDEFTSAFDEKSEKWQEGDSGTAVNEWINSFDSVELDDAELEAPEPLEEVEAAGLEELENLETEPAS